MSSGDYIRNMVDSGMSMMGSSNSSMRFELFDGHVVIYSSQIGSFSLYYYARPGYDIGEELAWQAIAHFDTDLGYYDSVRIARFVDTVVRRYLEGEFSCYDENIAWTVG